MSISGFFLASFAAVVVIRLPLVSLELTLRVGVLDSGLVIVGLDRTAVLEPLELEIGVGAVPLRGNEVSRLSVELLMLQLAAEIIWSPFACWTLARTLKNSLYLVSTLFVQ